MVRNLLVFILLVSFGSVFGQLSFSPNPVEVSADPMETEDIQADFEIKNDGDREYQLGWKLEVANQPSTWQYYVCDTEVCYNINQNESSSEKPNILKANSSIVVMFHTLPSETEGTGEYKISFFDISDPNEILLEVPVNVNTVTTSNKEVLVKGLSIFPNPASDYFRVNTGDIVKKIDLHNIAGKKINSFVADQGRFYDISNLSPGMYYVRLLDEKGKAIKVTKLKKD